MARFTQESTFYSVSYTADTIVATEDTLARIYDGAYRLLMGDELATHAGLAPADFIRLCMFDPKAEQKVREGRTANKADIAGALINNALEGDTKAAHIILTHSHDWKPAKHEGENSNEIRIVVENAESHIVTGIDGGY